MRLKQKTIISKFFDIKAIGILLSIAIIVTLFAVVSIVFIISTRNKREYMRSQERQQVEMEILHSTTSLGIGDFYGDSRDPTDGISYPAWNRKKTWSKDDVKDFWIDVDEAGLGTLKEDNDELILESLGGE